MKKRVMALMSGLLITGAMYAHEAKDTVPVNMNTENYPKTAPQSVPDTTPPNKWSLDTAAKWKQGDTSRLNTIPDTPANALNSNNNALPEPTAVPQKETAADTNASVKENNPGEKKSPAATTEEAEKKVSDRLLMKDGQMVVIKNGEESKMEKDVKLASGTLVMVDGTVKMKSGNVTKLKDGQYIALTPEKPVKKAKKKPGENADSE
ncbi:MAG: hypothetical protein QM791_02065 [Ferruginibacter sp.]